MRVLRTPDSRFEHLHGYDYAPRYCTICDRDGTELRIHYLDEGPPGAEPILLMHGNPSWSYIYRKMIPGLLKSGRRVVAVDLVGLGRSDKPAKRKYYSQARHIEWMQTWLKAMDLKQVTLFCQDWGGVIGLNLVADNPERFDRVVVANSGLPAGDGGTKALRVWQFVMKFLPVFPLKTAMTRAVQAKDFNEEQLTAYRAPFPSLKYQAGILAFPGLIALFPDNPGVPQNKAAWQKLGRFSKPVLTLFGNRDPISRGLEKLIHQRIPGATGQNHKILKGGGHFIQEDKPEELVSEILSFLEVYPRTAPDQPMECKSKEVNNGV
ncbi:MAG: haloalkane dehalogenase [Pseudomonadota bacterium]